MKTSPQGIGHKVESFAHQFGVLSERWNNRLEWSTLDFAKEYVRGRLCVVVYFDPLAGGDPPDEIGGAAHGGIVEGRESAAIGVADHESNFRKLNHWVEHSVLIRVVHQMKIVQAGTFPAGKDFQRSKHTQERFRGCFYSLDRGFETDPTVSRRKLEVAVLRAAVPTDDFPGHVVQSDPQIVDSIAYCESDAIRGLFSGVDLDVNLACLGIGQDSQAVGVLLNKRRKLAFDITDVMFGPFDF